MKGEIMSTNAHPILWCAGLACVLWSCGGRVAERVEARDASPPASASSVACRPTTAIASDEAVAIARACGGMPPGATLAAIASEAPLSPGGLTMNWGLVFVDSATGKLYRGVVGVPSTSIAPAPEYGTKQACTTEAPVVASSSKLVPQAIATFKTQGWSVAADSGLFFRAMGDCPDVTGGQSAEVWIRVDAPGGPGWWSAQYDLTGSYSGICGPCAGKTNCAACPSQ